MASKINSFKKVRKFLSNVEYINCGGCGISALTMYRWLQQNNRLKGDEHFVYLYREWDKEYFVNNAKALENKKLRPDACYHVVLFHKGKYIDCKEEHKPSDYKYVHFNIDEKFLKKSLKNKDAWNYAFDREYSIPFIEKNININLEDIK